MKYLNLEEALAELESPNEKRQYDIPPFRLLKNDSLVELTEENAKILKQLAPLHVDAKVYTLSTCPIDRMDADGLFYFIIKHQDYSFAVLYSDFKVNGGSFGKENSNRARHFLQYLGREKMPLIFLTNSIGVRLMEGRQVFNSAFGILPELAKYAQDNLFLTGNIGRSLGLGALIFSMGHYRYSIEKNGPINLTGPEVIKLFFGNGHDFEEISCSKNHQKNSSLVHELCENKTKMMEKMRTFIEYTTKVNHFYNLETSPLQDIYQLKTVDERVDAILAGIADEHHEVFSQLDSVIKTFIIRRNGSLVGVLINPPGNPNNIINIKTLEKYQAALDLFKTMKLPILSFLDTPGASPLNFIDSKKEIILCLKETAEKIITYPHPKAGFIIGRSFGGATILALPKVFGGQFQYIVKGSQVGIMHESIIAKVLGNNERLHEQWKETSESEPVDFSDLIENGTIDGVIDYEAIAEKVDQFIIANNQDLMKKDIAS